MGKKNKVQKEKESLLKTAFKSNLTSDQEIREAVTEAVANEILLPAESGIIELDNPNHKIYKVKQREIIESVDLNTAKNAFDLQLHSFAPYNINYTRNGRYLLIGGRKGHVATFDCQTMNIGTELQLQEDVYDVQYLQNETMFAVAQKRCVYIYDRDGVEIHCMRGHERPLKLNYLPYHFLLTSVSHSGWIKWHDISIGEYVAGYQTGHGPCRIMKQNPRNAIMHLGHGNGIVTFWSPNAGKALVSMLCHRAAVTDLAIDREGNYMATSGLDGYLKIWDLRKLSYLHSFKLEKPASTLDISDRGCLAVGYGRKVQILRDAFTRPYDVTYLQHEIRTPNAALSHGGGVTAATKALKSNVGIHSIEFRPLEDVLCIGHSHGITSVIVPGSGEPNFDSYENNPFLTTKQRREAEVQNLLNKLSSDMIVLESNAIGALDVDEKALKKEQEEIFFGKDEKDLDKKEKNKKRGRNKISAKLRRKQKNVIDEQVVKLKEKLKEEKERKAKEIQEKQQNQQSSSANDSFHIKALDRFK